LLDLQEGPRRHRKLFRRHPKIARGTEPAIPTGHEFRPNLSKLGRNTGIGSPNRHDVWLTLGYRRGPRKGPLSTRVCKATCASQIRLRCVAQCDLAQAALLDRLGIVLPNRMRIVEHEAPRLAATA
jgi:hypothetical protein